MAIISRLLYNATGIMPQKEIIRTCKRIGIELGKDCKPGENIDLEKLRKLLTEAVGTKKANKIVITDDLDTFKKYTKSLGFDDDLSETYFMGTKSAVLQNPKDKTILLSLRTAGEKTEAALNIASHELEHALFYAISPRATLEKIYMKLRGQKFLNNLIQKYGQLLNEKNMELQQNLLWFSKLENGDTFGGYTKHKLSREGLLKQTDMPLYKTLRDNLDDFVHNLMDNDHKTNIKVLRTLRDMLKEESRAYKTGGAVERFWQESIGNSSPNATKSEIYAMLYDETIPSIKSELKKQQIERFKNIFKIKSKPAKNENI